MPTPEPRPHARRTHHLGLNPAGITPMRTPTLTRFLILSSLCLSLPACSLWSRTDTELPPAPDTSARVSQADALIEEGRVAEALAQLALAIRENPTLSTAYVKMADIHKDQGNYSAAEASYREAGRLEPSNFHVAYNHGLVLQLLNRLSEAVRAYLRALSINPNDRDANLNLATAYLQLAEPAQALPYAERAAASDAAHGPSRVNLGAVYAALNRHAEAVSQYEAAADLMALTPQLLLNLADSLSRINRYEEMLNTLDRLVALQPSALAYERRGSALFRLRRYDDALASFRNAARSDPNHYPALNGVGVVLLNQYLLSQQKDRDLRNEGLDALRRSLKLNPNQPRILELVSRFS